MFFFAGRQMCKVVRGELTDDELDQIAGKRDVLLGKIQEKYGIAQDEADKRIKAFEKSLD